MNHYVWVTVLSGIPYQAYVHKDIEGKRTLYFSAVALVVQHLEQSLVGDGSIWASLTASCIVG